MTEASLRGAIAPKAKGFGGAKLVFASKSL